MRRPEQLSVGRGVSARKAEALKAHPRVGEE